jgi:hypothetical protein
VTRKAFGMVVGVSVFGVLRPYFFVENNQDITVDAEFQAHVIPRKKSTFKYDVSSDLENNAKPGTELHDWKGTCDHCGTK